VLAVATLVEGGRVRRAHTARLARDAGIRRAAAEDRTTYIHLREACVVAAGVSPLPVAGMYWRGRLSEVSGWSFGHLGAEPPAAAGQSNA
jgi:hypothetical protein